MNKFVRKMRPRRKPISLQRAIETARTPSLREELLVIAQRQIG